VARLLGRRYSADGLSLIFVGSAVDRWPLCRSTIGYGSANLANSACHSSGIGKWIVWITNRWRLLNGRLGLLMAAWPQAKVSERGLG